MNKNELREIELSSDIEYFIHKLDSITNKSGNAYYRCNKHLELANATYTVFLKIKEIHFLMRQIKNIKIQLTKNYCA